MNLRVIKANRWPNMNPENYKIECKDSKKYETATEHLQGCCKNLVFEDMVSLIERMNYAFYVEGNSKALRPIMAETKELLKKARVHLNLGPSKATK